MTTKRTIPIQSTHWETEIQKRIDYFEERAKFYEKDDQPRSANFARDQAKRHKETLANHKKALADQILK